jgi:Protein of unknown function (DUF1488)
MTLQQGEIVGYDFNRMVVEFTMINQGKVVSCAISTAALDELEGSPRVKADHRVEQFVRFRAVVEERAEKKFSDGFVEVGGRIVLRSGDFQHTRA